MFRTYARLIALIMALVFSVTLLSGVEASSKPEHAENRAAELTVMGTTDIHGNIYNWDYFRDREYDDSKHNDVGLAKVSTLVNQIRAEKGRDNTLLLDAGDIIQGTPLDYYYAKVNPATNPGVVHPMAKAMNYMRYDAAAIGNHEFNYGIPFLNEFEEELKFPLISANVVEADSDENEPAYKPYVIKKVKLKGQKPVKVGIIGFTPPGVIIWDKRNVEGKLEFPDIVETAKKYVPEMKEEGADVIVAISHSGTSGTSSYGPEVPLENASVKLAEEVPGIDAIIAGHSHAEIGQTLVKNKATGKDVLITQPLKWGMRLSVIDLKLEKVKGRWTVASKSSKTLNSNTVPEDPKLLELLKNEHQTTVKYVNTAIGTSTAEWSSAESRYKDTPIIDLINKVQTEAVKKGLAGKPQQNLPVLSIAAPFSRTSYIPKGSVTIKDIAGLYIYDNTLLGVEMTGAQVKEYLEYSAKYFNQQPESGPVNPESLTNANRTPDYNYDIISGVSYDIDVSKPVGQRIQNLSFNGMPVAPGQRFVVAINNYRQSGGGNFPYVKSAPIAYDEQQEIRQLLIEWVQAQGTIAPEKVFELSWRLTRNGQPVF